MSISPLPINAYSMYCTPEVELSNHALFLSKLFLSTPNEKTFMWNRTPLKTEVQWTVQYVPPATDESCCPALR